MASAVRTVARALGRAPEQIPADPALLGRRLADMSAVTLGISEGRLANIRSLLVKALELTRPMLPGRHLNTLSPAWSALHKALPARGDAHRLSRLLHWLSAREIAPAAVTADDLEAFGIELREASLSKSPERDWREVGWVWNKAQRTVPGWPRMTVTVGKRREGYTFPWSVFPASLKADVDRYLDRMAGRDLLDDIPFRPVRPETVAMRERQLRTFASALVQRGRKPATLRTIADLVEISALKDGLRFFLERNNGKSSTYIAGFAATLKAVAEHHVKVDSDALDEIKSVLGRLRVPTTGLTRRNRDRLRPFNDSAVARLLAELPLRLMREADSAKLCLRRAALLAQTAVAIEILLMAPIRLRNLLALEFDRTLIVSGAALHIVFEGHETKNHRVIDIPLPPESADLIRHYRDRYLPLLSHPRCRLLFPGRSGAEKSRSALRTKLGSTIRRYTGLEMNPHFFRHARAKIHLDRRPGEYATVSMALGHRSIDATRKFYSGLESAAAMRHFDDVILALRQRQEEP